ncbi:MAG: hypothetical protein ACTSUS_07990, partial [Candidatus Freyarchaeota archaeon]
PGGGNEGSRKGGERRGGEQWRMVRWNDNRIGRVEKSFKVKNSAFVDLSWCTGFLDAFDRIVRRLRSQAAENVSQIIERVRGCLKDDIGLRREVYGLLGSIRKLQGISVIVPGWMAQVARSILQKREIAGWLCKAWDVSPEALKWIAKGRADLNMFIPASLAILEITGPRPADVLETVKDMKLKLWGRDMTGGEVLDVLRRQMDALASNQEVKARDIGRMLMTLIKADADATAGDVLRAEIERLKKAGMGAEAEELRKLADGLGLTNYVPARILVKAIKRTLGEGVAAPTDLEAKASKLLTQYNGYKKVKEWINGKFEELLGKDKAKELLEETKKDPELLDEISMLRLTGRISVPVGSFGLVCGLAGAKKIVVLGVVGSHPVRAVARDGRVRVRGRGGEAEIPLNDFVKRAENVRLIGKFKGFTVEAEVRGDRARIVKGWRELHAKIEEVGFSKVVKKLAETLDKKEVIVSSILRAMLRTISGWRLSLVSFILNLEGACFDYNWFMKRVVTSTFSLIEKAGGFQQGLEKVGRFPFLSYGCLVASRDYRVRWILTPRGPIKADIHLTRYYVEENGKNTLKDKLEKAYRTLGYATKFPKFLQGTRSEGLSKYVFHGQRRLDGLLVVDAIAFIAVALSIKDAKEVIKNLKPVDFSIKGYGRLRELFSGTKGDLTEIVGKCRNVFDIDVSVEEGVALIGKLIGALIGDGDLTQQHLFGYSSYRKEEVEEVSWIIRRLTNGNPRTRISRGVENRVESRAAGEFLAGLGFEPGFKTRRTSVIPERLMEWVREMATSKVTWKRRLAALFTANLLGTLIMGDGTISIKNFNITVGQSGELKLNGARRFKRGLFEKNTFLNNPPKTLKEALEAMMKRGGVIKESSNRYAVTSKAIRYLFRKDLVVKELAHPRLAQIAELALLYAKTADTLGIKITETEGKPSITIKKFTVIFKDGHVKKLTAHMTLFFNGSLAMAITPFVPETKGIELLNALAHRLAGRAKVRLEGVIAERIAEWLEKNEREIEKRGAVNVKEDSKVYRLTPYWAFKTRKALMEAGVKIETIKTAVEQAKGYVRKLTTTNKLVEATRNFLETLNINLRKLREEPKLCPVIVKVTRRIVLPIETFKALNGIIKGKMEAKKGKITIEPLHDKREPSYIKAKIADGKKVEVIHVWRLYELIRKKDGAEKIAGKLKEMGIDAKPEELKGTVEIEFLLGVDTRPINLKLYKFRKTLPANLITRKHQKNRT